MKRLSLFSSAALVALLAVAPARAGLVAWSYNGARTPVSIPADSPGTGGVFLTDEPMKSAVGSSDIVLTNIHVLSSASADAPDMLMTGGQYTLQLTITDTASGKTGILTWNGKLSGSFSASSANLTNAILSPVVQMLTLGSNVYTVTVGPYSPPGPPTASNVGSIAAHVDISGSTVQGNSPEPSTMVLSGLGLSLLGGMAWRRRRSALRLA
jgi:hypothetical protein